MTRPNLEIGVSLALVCIACVLLLEALTIRAPANVFPSAIISIVALLATFNAVRAVWRVIGRTHAAQDTLKIEWVRVSVLVLGALVYAVALPLGYVPTTAILLFILYILFAEYLTFKVILLRAVIAVGLTLIAYYGFDHLLGVDLPRVPWL